MIESFLALEPKDKFTSIGIIVTAIIGIATLFFSILNNQRNIYSSTILKERLDSLNNLKKNAASFISLILVNINENNLKSNYKELKYLSNLIEYQFNTHKREELEVVNKLRYLVRLIQLRTEEKDIVEMENFIKKYDLEFFRKLYFEYYNVQTLNRLIDRNIYEKTEEIENLLKNHIKSEWEKIKDKQKILRYK
ncbi:hypothetical protein COL10_24895 [Bacillus cereus]|uniref:hypothetical protein n=1 Tax=Bacillus cereus group TaxID=86661 RepID=UPI000BF82237|nr:MULTISPECIES: hypothetical protein [Bacillus cereus group]MDF9663785.1 hypothetical protein [Bacillus wiedmannii]PEQ53051.1 hypothetical protein CN468_02615 [Bacillus cereus]PFD68884.1 hypothetical protein CN301_26175 [Bacillus cereus]PFV05436.1 hypothetical protein COL10_24895 [Bacillus cereus]PGV45089.1 hypothetical protein COD74_13045 [Bacillus cereus]